ncbi:glycoside hydrolase family 38 N-terminal domain-containing protein, partial [Thermococcus sp.]
MKVFVVPHFHYDLEWVRTKEEFAELSLSNMEKVLEIMRKDGEFKYLFDQLFLLELFKERKPELWNELLERIREGAIELVGGIYLMPDNLIPGLETQIREILYAKPVMEEFSGKEVKVGWMIDCFGHHSQIPQIFKKAGFEFYTFKRGYRGEKTMNFIWEGLDGSRIFVHYMLFGY